MAFLVESHLRSKSFANVGKNVCARMKKLVVVTILSLLQRGSAKKPHIVLLTTDQHRLDAVSAYSGDRGQTKSGIQSPNIDALAAQGIRFTESFSASPVCSPCRQSLLTGVHVPVHGVIENTVSPRKDGKFESYFCQSKAVTSLPLIPNLGLSTLPDVLETLSYTSFLIGKSHFSPVPKSFIFQV